MFVQNKYYKCYYSIVNQALSREILKGIYTEKHHIIPKSLGGSNDPTNLVVLTAREHFICHLLLTKMCAGKDRRNMLFAMRRMLGKYTPISRLYQSIKTNANNATKEYWRDPENKQRQSATMTKRWADPKVREEQSIRQKQLHVDHPEIGKKKSRPGKLNGMFNKTHTDKVKASLSLLPAERFGGKTYEEIYGEEKATQLKADRSIAIAKWRAESPDYGKGSSNPNAKTYTIMSPAGEQFIVTGRLQQFSKEQHLPYCMMRELASGTRDEYKGWTAK